MIKSLICDFDGTLIDSFEANFYCYKDLLAEYNFLLTRENYQQAFGLRLDKLLQAIEFPNSQDLILEIKEKKAIKYINYFKYLKRNDNLIDFLRYSSLNGIKLALVSTASKKNIENILNYYNLDNIFDIIISGEDVNNGKPAPDGYLLALKKLNCLSSETMIFEDSDVGFQAAKVANILAYPVRSF